MTNSNANSQDKHVNPMDEFFDRDQENEISSQQSIQQDLFDVNADDLAHSPNHTSQEHSLDDTHDTLTQSCFNTNDLLSAAQEAASKKNQQD